MKKAYTAALLIILCLSACSGGTVEPSSPSAATTAEDGTETSSQTETQQDADVTQNAHLTVEYASSELLAEGSYEEFTDYDSEYQTSLVFSTDTSIKDVCFLSLSFNGLNGDDMEFDTEELYHLDELTPERPLVINMTFVGTIPDRGISYTDADGSVKYYTINMSGKDGSPLLDEFKK